MLEILQDVFSPSQYMPHGNCYLWQSPLIWLHVSSDLIIAIAYFSIPATLIFFAKQARTGKDINLILMLFSLFILSCGIGHAIDVWVLWHPAYWLQGLEKAFTAIISAYTALQLVSLIPQFLSLKSPQELDALNQTLAAEIEERKRADSVLQTIVAGTSSKTGQQFFDVLVQTLAEALKVEQCFITSKTDQSEQGNDATIASYGNVPEGEIEEFMVDLISSQDQVIGYLGIRYAATTVNNNLEYSYALIRVFARRAATELERQSIYNKLEKANQLLELKIAERTEALEYANQRLKYKFDKIEQQKEMLIESEKRFRSLVDNLPGVVYRCRADEHLSVEFVSEAIEDLSGYSWVRFINGQNSLIDSIVHPLDRVDIIQTINEAIKNRTSFDLEYRIIHQNGSTSWINNRGAGIFNDEGKVEYVDGVMVNITETKTLEYALRREKDQLYSILHNAPVDIALFDAQMRYLAYSEQWKQQYCPQEDNLLGRCHYDIFPDLPSKWVGYCDRAIKGEIVGAKEEVFELPPDKRFYIKWTAQPWYTPENTIGGIVIVSQNINELVKARESAIENAQIKARFLANMSHEIRTPMNGILGMAELLLNQTTHAQQKELLTVLYQSGQHLLVIINDILDFSKLEAKETHLEHQPFNLPECVQSVVRLLTPQAEAKHISLTVDIPTNIPTYVLGDVNRLRQILTNLAGNSVKFTDEGGVHIAVELKSWQETEALIRFSVIDNGLGIKPQHQSKLFRSFSQIDDSSTRNYGGTGLGLAISKQLVELMGGTIGLESKYGQGSTFWIEVPWEIADHDFYGDNLPALDLSQMNALIVREYENKESRHKLWHGLNYWQVNVTQVETLALVMDQLHAGDDHRYDLIIVPYHSEVPNFCRNVETLRQQMPHATIAIMLAAQELELLKPWLAQHNLQELVCPFTGNHILEELMTHFNLDSPGDNSTMDLSQERANFKILVAEDTRINQEVIINQLQTIGYSAITCVSNGELALSAMEKEHFDLILMDCLMPVLDGYQTTEIIRDREADQEHIPIIALTASAIVGEQQKCLAVGMDEYISKPISMKALEKVLDRYVLKKVQLQVQGDHSPALAHGPLINFERLEKFWGSDRALWKQMLHIYQEDAPIYAQELQAAIEEEDYELIYNHAHRLKGASSSAAVEIIPHLCHDIEKLAQQKTTENMDKIMTKIFEQLAQVYSLAKEFQSS